MLRDACLGACQSGRSCQVPLPRTRRLHLSLCRRGAREREKTAEAVQELIGSSTWKDLLSAKCRRREVAFTFTDYCASGCLIEGAALGSSSRGVTRCFGRIGFSFFIFFRVARSDFGNRRPGRASGRCSSQTPTRFEREQERG